MKDKRSLHLKVQEMCDCFVTADPLKEMTGVKNEADKREAALKWIALAILYGIDSNAKKISICKSDDGEVQVLAKYRESRLPSPDPELAGEVIEAIRAIAHFDEEEGKTPLAIGIRESSIEIGVKAEKEKGADIITLKFPK